MATKEKKINKIKQKNRVPLKIKVIPKRAVD